MGVEIRRKYGVLRRYFWLGPHLSDSLCFFRWAQIVPLNFFISAFPSRTICEIILEVVVGVRLKSFAICFVESQPGGISSSSLFKIWSASALTHSPLIKRFSCWLAQWTFHCAPWLGKHHAHVRESIRKPSRVASVASSSGLGCMRVSCYNSIRYCKPLGYRGWRF